MTQGLLPTCSFPESHSCPVPQGHQTHCSRDLTWEGLGAWGWLQCWGQALPSMNWDAGCLIPPMAA